MPRSRTVGLEERDARAASMTPERLAAMAAGRERAAQGKRDAGATEYLNRARIWADMGDTAMAAYFQRCAEEVRAGDRAVPDTWAPRETLESPEKASS